MRKANPDNDEFECEDCNEVFDIEDSIKYKGRYLCPYCEEKARNEEVCEYCGIPYDINDGHSCLEMRGGLD